MGGDDGSVKINTQLDTDGLVDGAQEAQRALEKLAKNGKSSSSALNKLVSAAKNVGSKLAGIGKSMISLLASLGKKVASFAQTATELGSNLDEVQNVVDVTFTQFSDKVDEFAKKAMEAYGISETMAKQFMGSFGSMSKAMGFTEEAAYNMSASLTALSGDVASFYNMSQEEAFNKLKGVFTGETEGLKSLGVVMTQSALQSYAAAHGIDKEISKMTEREKTALRYKFVLDKLKGAQGDFNRTSDGWANQTRVLQLRFDSILATLGKGLINVLNPVLKVVNKLLAKLQKLAEGFLKFTQSLPGADKNESKGGALEDAAGLMDDAAASTEDLAESEEAEAEAKKKQNKQQQKYLSGLDEARTYSSNKKDDDEGAEDEGLISIPDFTGLDEVGEKAEDAEDKVSALQQAAEDLKKVIQGMAGTFMEGFTDTMGASLPHLENTAENIKRIGKSIKDIFTDPDVKNAAKDFADSYAYNLGRVVGSATSIGTGIAQLLTGGIATYLEQNGDRIKQFIVGALNVASEIHTLIGDFFESLAEILEPLFGETAQQILADIIATVTTIFGTLTTTVLKLTRDLLNIVLQPIIDNKEKLQQYLQGWLEVIEPIVSGIRTGVQTIADKWTEVYDEHIKPFFDDVASGLSTLLGHVLDGYNNNIKPVLDKLAKRFQGIMEGPFGDMIDAVGDAIGSVYDLLREIWNEVLVPLGTWIIDNVYPILATVVEWIGTKLLDAFEWVIGKIKTGAEKFRDFVTTLKDRVQPAVEDLKKKFDEFKKNTLDPLFIFLKEKFIRVWNDIKTWLATNIPAAISTLKGKWEKFKTLWLDPFVEWMNKTFIKVWESLKEWLDVNIPKALDAMGSALTTVKETIIDPVGEFIKNVFIETLSDLSEWADTHLPQSFDELCTTIDTFYKDYIQPTAEFVQDVFIAAIDGIQSALQAVRDFLYNVFIGDWGAAWTQVSGGLTSAFEGLGDILGGIFDTVRNAAAGPINAIIDMINNMIAGLENGLNSLISLINNTLKVHIDPIPSPFGGNLFNGVDLGVSIPTMTFPRIPRIEVPLLAKGAVIPPNAPFVAMLGDQRNGKNLEAPADEIYRQALRAVQDARGSGREVVQVQVGGRTILDVVIDEARKQRLRTGKNVFEMA